MDGSPEELSDASSGFSGALYDATGRSGVHPTGAPRTHVPHTAQANATPSSAVTPPPPNWDRSRGAAPPYGYPAAPYGPGYPAAPMPYPPYGPGPYGYAGQSVYGPGVYGPGAYAPGVYGTAAGGPGPSGMGSNGMGSSGMGSSSQGPSGRGGYGPAYPAPGVPATPANPAPDGAFWSDAANDPWRDPEAPSALVLTPEAETPEVTPPDFGGKGRSASLGQVVLISVIAALLAGALGGALGYTAAVHGGGASTPLGSSSAPAIANRAPTSIAGVVKAVLPSVVMIQVHDGPDLEVGSGFIASADGYIITNQHVVDGLTGDATVTFNDDSTATAKLVGADTSSDIAVLKVGRSGLPAVTFGDSDAVAVGDPVLAVGAPLGLSSTVTYGIVSALHRPLEITDGTSPTRYYSAIQTDAAINHGNSGGPLFDAGGRVIGVDAAILTSTAADDAGNIGVGFAIPVDQARRTAEAIIDGQPVQHAVIGAMPQASYASGPNGGVPIGSVTPGGPADAAGIVAGDVILEVGGSPLTQSGDLTALVRGYAPGSIVPVVITHLGQRKTVQVKLAAGTG